MLAHLMKTSSKGIYISVRALSNVLGVTKYLQPLRATLPVRLLRDSVNTVYLRILVVLNSVSPVPQPGRLSPYMKVLYPRTSLLFSCDAFRAPCD